MVLKVRPYSQSDPQQERSLPRFWEYVDEENLTVTYPEQFSKTEIKQMRLEFDNLIAQDAHENELFDEILPLVYNSLGGYSSNVLL